MDSVAAVCLGQDFDVDQFLVDDLKDEMDKENRLTGITFESVYSQFSAMLTTEEELAKCSKAKATKDNTWWAVNNFYQWKKVASHLMTCLKAKMLWP